MIKVGILGCTGRMGKTLVTLLASDFKDRAVACAQAHRGGDLEALLQADVVIDFSSPAAMSQLAVLAETTEPSALPVFVIGTTGWKIDDRKPVETLAKKTPVLMSANFSIGFNALLEIIRQGAPLLDRLGYAPVVVETHHRHKKDAPSGSAMAMQRAIAGPTASTVQTHSVRGGEVIGDHVASFYGPWDHLSFGHFAQDRSLFARGAMDVALWLHTERSKLGLPAGFLSMETYLKSFLQKDTR